MSEKEPFASATEITELSRTFASLNISKSTTKLVLNEAEMNAYTPVVKPALDPALHMQESVELWEWKIGQCSNDSRSPFLMLQNTHSIDLSRDDMCDAERGLG